MRWQRTLTITTRPPPDEYQILALVPKGLDCMNEAYHESCGNDAGMACVKYFGGSMDSTYGAEPSIMEPPMDMYYGSGEGMGSGPMPPMDMYYGTAMPPMDGTYGMPPTMPDYGSGAGMGSGPEPYMEPYVDMYYGSGQGMGSGPPMPDCPICIEGFKNAGGCGLLEDLVSGVTSDDTALNAAIPAGCEEAGDDCGADALAECGFDPAMFEEMKADDDWGEVGCRCRYVSFHDRGCAGAVFYSTRLDCLY